MASGRTTGETIPEIDNLREIYGLLSKINALKQTETELEWSKNALYKVQIGALAKEDERLTNLLKQIENSTEETDIALKQRIEKRKEELKLENKLIELEKSLDKGFTGFLNKAGRVVKFTNDIGKSLSTTIHTAVEDSKNLASSWLKAQDSASKFAKSMAMSSFEMRKLADSTISNVVNKKLGARLNISSDEIIEAQLNALSEIGRNIQVYDDAQVSLAALHKLMNGGEKEFLSRYENFALGFEDTDKRVAEMFNNAAKHGISFSTYSENVKQNIAIAQNYTFKNGLRGLESMALKASAIKMDMQMIASFADKVGSVEGSMETAAKLQVLGGPFANFADPIGMLNESINDMEGLYDRIAKMTKGLGTFNKQTGEVTVSSFNRYRLKAAAEAMGMDYGRLMESVRAQARRNEIDRELKATGQFSNLTEDQRELLRNTATFKEGQAGVQIGNEFKALNKLEEDDFKALKVQTNDIGGNVATIVELLMAGNEKIESVKRQREARQAKGIGKLLGTYMEDVSGYLGKSNFWLSLINLKLTTMAIGNVIRGARGTVRKTGLFKGLFNKGINGAVGAAGTTETLEAQMAGATMAKRVLAGKDIAALRKAVQIKNAAPILGKGGATIAAKGALASKGAIAALGKGASTAMAFMASNPVGWIAAAVTAAVAGTAYGINKAKKNRESGINAQLASKGLSIDKKGYSARDLKIIEEGLRTGELTRKARRKLYEKGDTAILAEIDAIAKENGSNGLRSRRGISGKINNARFTVTNAYFSGSNIKDKNGFNIVGNEETGDNPILAELKAIRRNLTLNIPTREPSYATNFGSPKIELNLGGNIRLTTDSGISKEIGRELVKMPEFTQAIVDLINNTINHRSNTNNNNSGSGF